MAIKTTLVERRPPEQSRKPEYPKLRKWTGNGDKSIVVLFTDAKNGAPLQYDSKPDQIGMAQEWVNASSPMWVPCTITIASDDARNQGEQDEHRERKAVDQGSALDQKE